MKYGQIVSQIIQAIQDYGPMTRTEMCDHLGLTRESVSAVVTRMTRTGPETPKRLYIKSYVYDQEGQRRYPRAVYDLGDKPDARRPKADTFNNRKRYREKIKMLRTANSVFNLALPRRVYLKNEVQVQVPAQQSVSLEV